MDEKYMKMALELARLGKGHTKSNPMVGALIVKDNKIIGKGYHHYFGGVHAEIDAIENATENPEGSTIYVTLEPCFHTGKQPPCVERIIKEKIKRVVIATEDPNPKVSGKSVALLIKHGIKVKSGVLEKEALNLNAAFFHFIQNKTPYVIMKSAMTLDGKIATHTGDSKWISGEKTREYTRKLRGLTEGIMVGINTVILDNPGLTTRIQGFDDPIKIIIDSKLRIPKNAKVLKNNNKQHSIIYTTEKADPQKIKFLTSLPNVEVEITNSEGEQVNLMEMMENLGKRNISSILLEGGGTLNFSMLEKNLINRALFVISPKIVGGISAKTIIEGKGIEKMSEAIQLKDIKITTIENDIILDGKIH